MITLVIILSFIAAAAIFCIIKLRSFIKKQEDSDEYIQQLEDTVYRYDTYVIYIRRKVLDSYAVIKQLDTIGAFESDDETGTIFKNIKSIIESLNEDFEWLNQPELEQNEEPVPGTILTKTPKMQ